MKSTNLVLIISQRQDATADFIEQKLSDKHIPRCRINTETFATNWIINWEYGNRDKQYLITTNRSISFDSIKTIWYRRPQDPIISETITNSSARDFTLEEWKTCLSAAWQLLLRPNVVWVSYPDLIRSASRKPKQLQLARKLGFNVPHTLLTNDPVRMLEFRKANPNGVVFKALHQSKLESDKGCFFSYTGALTDEVCIELERLPLAPVLFQEYVKPEFEVRVTVIGSQVFAAKCKVAILDWRRVWVEDQNWTPMTLPRSIAANCRKLVKAYGLKFGTIDLIYTPQGKWFFLELNPNGQWVWIELITGQPLSESLLALFTSNWPSV